MEGQCNLGVLRERLGGSVVIDGKKVDILGPYTRLQEEDRGYVVWRVANDKGVEHPGIVRIRSELPLRIDDLRHTGFRKEPCMVRERARRWKGPRARTGTPI